MFILWLIFLIWFVWLSFNSVDKFISVGLVVFFKTEQNLICQFYFGFNRNEPMNTPICCPYWEVLTRESCSGLEQSRQVGPQHRQVFSHVQFARWTLPQVRVFQCMPVRFSQPALNHGKVLSSAQTVETRRMQWKGSDLVELKCFNFF